MLSVGRAGVVGLVLFWLGCSTEDTGLQKAGEAGVSSVMEEDPPPTMQQPAKKYDAAPDTKPPAPPADAAADAPAPLPTDAAPDLKPDLPPKTDQPQGASCGAARECRSGYCVDGVCCDKACNDGCNACVLARTGRADGTCSWAKDTEDKPCGNACSWVAAAPAVVEKVCKAGVCVVPTAPKVLTICRSADPCVAAFCDNNEARCVTTQKCPQQGTCCCRTQNGTRSCTQRTQCTGTKMCE